MASELIRPDTVSFLDTMLRDSSSLRVEDIRVGKRSQYVGKTLRQCEPLNDSRVLLVSLKHGESFQFNPPPSTTLSEGDALIVIGIPEQISVLRSTIGHEHAR